MPPTSPAHDLDEVRRQAQGQGQEPRVTRTLALDPVMARLDLTEPQARHWILALVADLAPLDFAETLIAKPPPADVYGVHRQGCGWYVKVVLEPDGRLVVISCHPPMTTLRTRSGPIR
ncbi:MAG: hypothetical protein EOO74_12470 [Myxococcales bacterium]|nr:MAG: hypothetical protein EOO74_12470 [Myxococcales bacterium]